MIAHKLWSWLAAVVTFAGLAGSASAQHFQPFIDPDYFDPDLQFFAPAEVDYFGDPEDPTTGWFFTYDRLNWYVSRAENGSRPWDSDMTWGNRFDIGYMTENDGGWLFSTTHVNGPTGGADSLNADLRSVELNKVFRFDPLHHNGIIEPFIGLRYMYFDDFGEFPFGNRVQNNILTGQLGVRAWKNIGHWKVASELRSFNGVNWQFFQTEDYATFLPGAEIRVEMQYSLTRDIALRVGWEGLYMFDGLARNNNLFDNSEDLFMHGVAFGFTVNR
jgi:hypothetical protein